MGNTQEQRYYFVDVNKKFSHSVFNHKKTDLLIYNPIDKLSLMGKSFLGNMNEVLDDEYANHIFSSATLFTNIHYHTQQQIVTNFGITENHIFDFRFQPTTNNLIIDNFFGLNIYSFFTHLYDRYSTVYVKKLFCIPDEEENKFLSLCCTTDGCILAVNQERKVKYFDPCGRLKQEISLKKREDNIMRIFKSQLCVLNSSFSPIIYSETLTYSCSNCPLIIYGELDELSVFYNKQQIIKQKIVGKSYSGLIGNICVDQKGYVYVNHHDFDTRILQKDPRMNFKNSGYFYPNKPVIPGGMCVNEFNSIAISHYGDDGFQIFTDNVY